MSPSDTGGADSQRGSPWHSGELAIQVRAGVAERMDDVGRRVVRDYMPDQHRQFFEQLPFLVMGAVDEEGACWATLLAGAPSFVRSPDPRTLSITAQLDQRDPLQAALYDGAAVGLLGIELHTRRRNRMNGNVLMRDVGFDVSVRRSFGNCPQYIQLRDVYFADIVGQEEKDEVLPKLDDEARRIIDLADTFFVASYADGPNGREVDVSHRGGPPGFIRLDGEAVTIPDYRGNFHFATLGNILTNGQAGIVFVDFSTGDLLQLSGRAEVVFDDTKDGGDNPVRQWRFVPHRRLRRRAALPLRWSSKDAPSMSTHL